MATVTLREAQAQLDTRAAELAAEAREIVRELRAQTRSVNLHALLAAAVEGSQGAANTILNTRVTTPELGRRIDAYNANVLRYRARRDEIDAARARAAQIRANAAAHTAACPVCDTTHPGEC